MTGHSGQITGHNMAQRTLLIVTLILSFNGPLNAEFHQVECRCYSYNQLGHLNTTCLFYCTEACVKQCQRFIQNLFSEEMLQSFTVHVNSSRSRTASGSIQFNRVIFQDLYPLRVQSCSFLCGPVLLNKYGKAQKLSNGWKTYKKTLNIEKSNNFYLTLDNHDALYMGIVECRFSNKIVLNSTEKLLTTSTETPIPTPKNLQSYFGRKIYGAAEDHRHVTLTWDPVDSWATLPSKYHVQCREVSKDCFECTENYDECRTCNIQGLLVQDEIVDWFKWQVTMEVFGSHSDLMLICAVRAVSAGKFSKWSKPVVEMFDKINPAPRLIISHNRRFLGHPENYWALLDMSTTSLNNDSTDQDAFPVLWETEHGKQSSHLIDSECCILYNKYLPRVFGLEARKDSGTGVESFCLNWITGTHYEARTCLGKTNIWCINEVDDTTGEEKAIYRAPLGRKISHVVCSPHEDFIAFTEEDKEDDNEHTGMVKILILFLTSIKLHQININPFFNSTIASTAIAIDWTDTSGSTIVFIAKNWYSAFSAYRYNTKSSTTEYMVELPILKGTAKIKEIGLDWSNFYLLTESLGTQAERRLQFFPRRSNKNVFMVRNFLVENYLEEGYGATDLNILERTSEALSNVPIGEIVDILPIDAEMRKIMTAEQYFPNITTVKNTSVSPSVMEIWVKYTYSSPLYSLRPAFQAILRFKNYSKSDEGHCDKEIYCKEVKSGMNLGRYTDTVTMTITGLENHRDYYVEVELKPLRSSLYYDRSNKSRRSFVFHMNYVAPPLISTAAIWIIISIVGAMLLIFLSGGFILYRRRRPKLTLLRLKSRYLRIKHKIGTGNTADVKIAILDPSRRYVAVKCPKNSTAEARVMHEALILQNLDHPNIIKPIGIVMDVKPYQLVLEYKRDGNVTDYFLKNSRVPQVNLFKIAIDIAKACCYLEQQGYVHTDISAKNVLLLIGRHGQIVRAYLTDFGLARDRGGMNEPYSVEFPDGPLLHSAPEALEPMGRLSAKSDVYSFGVFLWELFTHGKRPYSDDFNFDLFAEHMSYQDILVDLICNYGLLPCSTKPEGCPDEAYQLLKACWRKAACERPAFPEILSRLESIRNSLPPDIINLTACLRTATSTSSIEPPPIPEHVEAAYVDNLENERFVQPIELKNLWKCESHQDTENEAFIECSEETSLIDDSASANRQGLLSSDSLSEYVHVQASYLDDVTQRLLGPMKSFQDIDVRYKRDVQTQTFEIDEEGTTH